MILLSDIILTYDIDSVAVGAKPLSVCPVDSHAIDVDAGEKVVGEVSAVIAGYLHLIPDHIAIIAYLILFEHERSHVCAYPYIAVAVFRSATYVVDSQRGAIFIHERTVRIAGVRLRVIAVERRLPPVIVTPPQSAFTVEKHILGITERDIIVYPLIILVGSQFSTL